MFRLTRSQTQPIGLDIGSDSIKMLQLEVVGDSLSVTAAAKQAFAEDARKDPQVRMAVAVEMLRDIFKRTPFRGRNVVSALPRDILHIKNLRLPMIPQAELAAAVQFEARNIFPFDTESAIVHFLPAGEVRQGTDVRQEVIVLAAKHEDVNNYLEHIHRAGAIVESLDVEPCALFRTIERFIRRREDENEVAVLVDIGFLSSRVLIGKGREISFYKTIEIGSRNLHQAVADKLNTTFDDARAVRHRIFDAGEPTDPAAKRDPVRQAVFDATRGVMEELGREISLCLRYYSVTFRGQRPTRLRLLGGEACDPHLQTLLNAALTLPVEAGRPLFSVDTRKMDPSLRRGTSSEWTMALGLALRSTKGYFGARDGKPRDPNVPWTPDAPVAAGAEVVDLNKAVDAAIAASPTSTPAAVTSPAPARASQAVVEVANHA